MASIDVIRPIKDVISSGEICRPDQQSLNAGYVSFLALDNCVDVIR